MNATALALSIAPSIAVKRRHDQTRRCGALLSCASLSCASLGLSAQAQAQETFSLELDVGRNTGLSSYRDSIVHVEDSGVPDPDPAAGGRSLYRPYLADEQYSWGSFVGLRVVLNQIEVGLGAQWFTRDAITLRYRSEDLLARRRLRSDGTLDDRGVQYEPMEQPRAVRTVQRGRGDLALYTLGGGRRWSWTFGRTTLFVPVGLGLAVAHIDEPNHPYALGLQAYTAAGGSFQLSPNFALGAQARVMALGTLQYDRLDDAARHAAVTGGGSAAALTSTMLHSALHLSLIYIVR